jgi:hypothetical protein
VSTFQFAASHRHQGTFKVEIAEGFIRSSVLFGGKFLSSQFFSVNILETSSIALL